MAISKDDLYRHALDLPEAERADLIGALLDSLDAVTEAGAEAAWYQELDRRARELDSGVAECIPWNGVRERLSRHPRE